MMISMRTLFLLLGIVIASVCSDNTIMASNSKTKVKIEKRELDWSSQDMTIQNKENINRNMRIDYLVPHTSNDEVIADEDYMAFTLYRRNGAAITADGHSGMFHFVNSQTARNLTKNCPRHTMHEGAYYYFYNSCPQDASYLVASGYCYQGSNGKGLVYNSMTFNLNSQELKYLDGNYYLSNGGRAVHSYEQNVIETCFNYWMVQDFSSTFKCTLGSIPAKRRRRSPAHARTRREAFPCGGCDCTISASCRAQEDWTIMFTATLLIMLGY